MYKVAKYFLLKASNQPNLVFVNLMPRKEKSHSEKVNDVFKIYSVSDFRLKKNRKLKFAGFKSEFLIGVNTRRFMVVVN